MLWQDSCGEDLIDSKNLILKFETKKELRSRRSRSSVQTENPHQDKLKEHKENHEAFPLELLVLLLFRSMSPMVGDFANTMRGNSLSKGMTFPTKNINSSRSQALFLGDPSCIKTVLIRISQIVKTPVLAVSTRVSTISAFHLEFQYPNLIRLTFYLLATLHKRH
ncbi:hypothetical protein Tco_0627178 [Tanacetum coccineum]|uniref:Uncharacterized protein n=1 Tax=Tanacetum coccineum TaxID=301880 RepID=A0ABQ4WLP3_9ASTR